MARPKIVIDENKVYELAKIHCTNEEIAASCNCSADTIERRFAGVIKRGREAGKEQLRRKMFEKAAEGNTTIMIWLSKQHLGMSDKIADLADKPTEQTVINLKYRPGDKPHEKAEELNANQAQHTKPE